MNQKIDHDELRRLVAGGLTDPQIAASLGVHRTTVIDARKKLGLSALYSPSAPPASSRAAMSAGGHKSKQLMWQRLRDKAAAVSDRYGLPAMRPKMVAALLSLLDGPLTLVGIRAKIDDFDSGFSNNRPITNPGKHYTLRTMKWLCEAGLVSRIVRASGPRRKLTPDVYMITMKALEVLGADQGSADGTPADRG